MSRSKLPKKTRLSESDLKVVEEAKQLVREHEQSEARVMVNNIRPTKEVVNGIRDYLHVLAAKKAFAESDELLPFDELLKKAGIDLGQEAS